MGAPLSSGRRCTRWLAFAAIALCFAGGAAAQTAEGGAAPPGPQHDERALEVARRMADALSGAKALRVTVEVAYDAVQADGAVVEFGGTRSYAVRRPDRARAEAVDRSGARLVLVYDGSQIALADAEHEVYATAPYSGDVDGMLLHLRDELSVPLPLAEFVSPGLYDLLAASESADWVGEQTLGGVACDQLAFRNAEKGLQLWVPKTGAPLPRRIVITYERARGRPQFRADLRDWDLAPQLPDSLFVFEPEPGAERIVFRRGGQIVGNAPSGEAAR